MAVFNNGRITASVTPPQGYTGSYRYTLYIDTNGTWTQYGAGNLQNPVSVASTQHVFGNPGATDENKEGDPTWQGLEPGTYKVEVETLDGGLNCSVESTVIVGVDAPNDPCVGFNISGAANGETAIIVTVTGGQAPFSWTLDGNSVSAPDVTDNGDGTFTFSGLTADTVYTVGVEDANPCTDSVAVTTDSTSLTAFECGDTTITIANGTENDAIPTSAVTATGVSNIIAVYETGTTTPATYINGTQSVDVVFEVPGGYSNAGDSFTCSANATGTASGGGGGTDNTTWYWFHGLDNDWLSAGSSYTLTNAPQFGMFTNGSNVQVTTDINVAMQHYFDNQSNLSNGTDILSTDWSGPITGDAGSQQFVYNELTGISGDYYVMVPATSDFPEDLTNAGITIFPTPGIPQNCPQKTNVTVNGNEYVLYLLPGSGDSGSRTLTFS